MKLRIASFDIGKRNFAQYIEEFESDLVEELEVEYKNLPKKDRRRVKGPMNNEIRSILSRLAIGATRIQTGVYNLTSNDNNLLDVQTRKNIIDHLLSFQDLWETCDIFIIEQQYFKTWSGGRRGGGTEANVDAIKIGELVLTWLLLFYPEKIIQSFGSQNKTLMLGAPSRLGKDQRKKWAVEKTRELYRLRNDDAMIEMFKLCDSVYRKHVNTEEKIQNFMTRYPQSFDKDCQFLAERVVRHKQKLDDISDACLQCQAFKFKTMVACF